VSLSPDYEQTDGTTLIDEASVSVTGDVTQSGGDTTLSAGSSVAVSGTYVLSDGTVQDPGSGTLLSVGSLSQSGGTFTVINGAQLTSAADITVSGGTLVLSDGGLVHSASDVTIQSGGTLNGLGSVTIDAGALVVAGTLNVGGVTTIGTLQVNGNYTQTSGGTLNIELQSSSNYDRLQVSGAASLAGAIVVTGLNGYRPAPGLTFYVITAGSTSGSFDSVSLPPLSFGVWHYSYAGGFTIWVSYF
jgi:hypothetical protein